MKRYLIYVFIAGLFILTLPVSLMAQGGPPATPIDGGLSLLLAAGGAYGIRQIVKNKKK